MIPYLKAGLCVVLLMAASLPPAPAEQPIAPPSVSSPAADDAMQLYLVVHDKHDRPVLDLKPEELALTDDGSPAKLDNLQLVNSRKPATNLVTFVFDPFPPDKDAHPKKPSAKIENARDAALKILSLLSESGFQFSVFNIDSRLHLQQEFTSDLTAVETAINAVTGPAAARDKKSAARAEKDLISVALSGADASGRPVSARDRLLAQSSYAALRNATRIAQDRHISPSLSSLTAIVQAQQDINQRKTIIYLSAMDQATINDVARQAIASIIGSANQAGVNIDVVDCLGLGPHGSRIKMLDPNSQGALVALNTISTPGGSISIPPDAGDLEVTEDAPVNADLQHLAVATGGTYLNGDGQRKSLQQITDDMTSYYQASFVPRMNGYDGRFHPLIVKPVRTGLRIRTQTGYLALPPPAADGSRPEPFELPLLKLLSQAPLPAQLPFRAAVLDLGSSADGSRGVLAIELPVANLSVERDANSSSSLAHVTMIAEIKDQTGAVAAHFSSNAPQRFTLRTGAPGSAQVISLQRHFILPPGKYTLQALLVDTVSDKAGAQSIPFEISASTAAPSLSNLVLVRRADPVPANSDGAGDPLFTGKARVTPNISGSLPSGDTNASIFFAGHVDTQSSQPARLQISVLRDGNILGGKPAIDRQVSGEEYFSFLTSLGINHPTDGAYQIEALLTQGGKSATSIANFTLSGTAIDDDPPGASPSIESIARPAGPLDITVSTNPDLRPPADELKTLLADAAQFAGNYWDSLPNFTCEDVTERFVGAAGSSKWEHTDTLTGELTYYDHQEDWQFRESEKHHRKSHDSASDTEQGISSAGIFGSVIRGLFRPASKAQIEWTQSGTLGGGVVQVFNYRVARENSNLSLRIGPTEVITVGYHGMVYIDSATHGVRRITEIADDVPRNFPIRGALLSADYDYVSIGGQQYLLPIGAQVILRKGRRETDLNQIHFRNFHRFRTSARILSVEPEPQH